MNKVNKNDIFRILGLTPLTKLSEEWVTSVFDSNFVDAEDIDEEVFQDTDHSTLVDALKSLLPCLDLWIENESEECLWVCLTENDISLKAIVVFLAHLIIVGHKKSADVSQKELGILAGRTYCKLSQVQGSWSYFIFQLEVFQKTIDYLKQFIVLGSSKSTKRKRKSLTPAKGKRSSKSRHKQKSTDTSIEDFDGSLDADSRDEDNELAPQEIASLRKNLHALLVDVVAFLEKFSLRQAVSMAYYSVEIITPLTRHETETFDGNFDSSVSRSRQSIPALAYKCLQALCGQHHGHVRSIINSVFKHLMPNLIMLVDMKPVQTVTKQITVTQDHAATFVCILIKQCGDKALENVRTLIQHMCVEVTDRAEYRTRVTQTIVHITKEMPNESYSKLVRWFHKLSRNTQPSNRCFAVEISSALLALPERTMTDDVSVDLLPYTSHSALLGLILDKCTDVAASVRARGISCLTPCFGSRDEGIAGILREIVTPQVTATGRPNQPRLIKTPGATRGQDTVTIADETSQRSEVTIAQQTIEGASTVDRSAEGGTRPKDTPMHHVNLTPGVNLNLTNSKGVFSMLRSRLNDSKQNVRKAAVQALEAAVRFEMPNFTKENLDSLTKHYRDPVLSVRKQVFQSLKDLLMDNPKDTFLQSNWLLAALPLVMDRETTVSEKCMDTLEEVLIRNIVAYQRSKSDRHQLAWDLLHIIALPENVDKRRYLQKACRHWSRQGKIKSALMQALKTHIGTCNNAAGWMLLAEVAPAAPEITHGFLLEYWQNEGSQEKCYETMNRVLTVMKYVAKHMSTQERDILITDLNDRLMKFESPPDLISVSISTLSKLCSEQAKALKKSSLETEWSWQLLTTCDKYLSSVVLEGHDGVVNDEDKVVSHLFTLGEVVQLFPGKVPKRVNLLVQSMIAAPCITSPPASQPHNTIHTDQLSQGEQDSRDSQGSSQQASQPLTQFRGCVMSNRIRAFAFVTLGKLCLQNEDLAKKCIAALARELEISKDPAIRNNVVIIMSDLCVRYTTTANAYISNIASCLKDPSQLVRKQTLTVITRLLQEDYIKWKGALFYRFISTLLDTCDEIKAFAEFCLLHMLIQRNPNMFFQHFVECLFHFNDYKKHTIYNKFTQSNKDREMFSLNGEKNKEKRMTLYKFLLENMTDNHRFQLKTKLTQEILGETVDDILPINDETKDVLKDALAILSCKEIKLTSLRKLTNEKVAGDSEEMAEAVAATAKKTIMTKVLKNDVVENIVPVVISLKHKLEEKRSPLQKDLLLYLRELMKDYKKEVKEVLSADRRLATEIEFDLRKLSEEEEQGQNKRNTPVVLPASPTVRPGRSPRPGFQSPQHNVGASPGPHVSPRTPALKSASRLTPARPVGSPKTPALKTAVASPRPSTSKGTPPVVRIGPDRNTPARRTPLATIAVLNSMRHTPSAGDAVVKNTPNKPTEETKEAGSPKSGKTPSKNIRSRRAISTPSAYHINITFDEEANMTFLPPSPIAETSSDHLLFDSDASM
ncbi:condensin-2 complex subunit D3-L-like [Ruditapes philippinarum]|uniref:condensin-2 complex subunit D3-L-like n=1 Tax=Ruditapes philippinarum TaxID=129788 RepID=UPI00295A72C3|nr:condensin-2 complex subunit D3-L-like [Ruditapes philippinarum]